MVLPATPEKKKETIKKKTQESKYKVELKQFLQLSAIEIEAKRQAVTDDCTRRGIARSSYHDTVRIKVAMEGWHDEVLKIFKMISYFSPSIGEIKLITKLIIDFIDKDIGFEDSKPVGLEYVEFKKKMYVYIQTAIREGEQSLIAQRKANSKDAFRIYFPLALGICGTLLAVIGAVFGAAIGAWATLYASHLITWPFK